MSEEEVVHTVGDEAPGERVRARPERVQLRRVKGWRMPPNTVKVDRSTRWGNPFTREALEAAGQHGCRTCQVVNFEQALGESGREMIRRGLAGKNLACWCALDQMCHADILLAIANGHEPFLPADSALTCHANPNENNDMTKEPNPHE